MVLGDFIDAVNVMRMVSNNAPTNVVHVGQLLALASYVTTHWRVRRNMLACWIVGHIILPVTVKNHKFRFGFNLNLINLV